jgi:hypothetical protein
MILQAVTDVSGASEVCLSYLALGGIFFLGTALGFAVCTVLNRNPVTDLGQNLISNLEALRLIDNFHARSTQGDAVSGHLELGTLVGYIDRMKAQCKTVGIELSGLEYYFAKYGVADHPPNENQNTIVVFPTYEDNGAQIPIDPFLPFVNGRPVTVVDLYADFLNDRNIPANLEAGQYTSSNVLNRTNMSPPRPPLTL